MEELSHAEKTKAAMLAYEASIDLAYATYRRDIRVAKAAQDKAEEAAWQTLGAKITEINA